MEVLFEDTNFPEKSDSMLHITFGHTGIYLSLAAETGQTLALYGGGQS